MSKTEINTNKLLELENKLYKYQQALEFYADPTVYEEVWINPFMQGGRYLDPDILDDRGARAREALGIE